MRKKGDLFNHVSNNTLIRSINIPNFIESAKTDAFRRYILIGPPLAQDLGIGNVVPTHTKNRSSLTVCYIFMLNFDIQLASNNAKNKDD